MLYPLITKNRFHAQCIHTLSKIFRDILRQLLIIIHVKSSFCVDEWPEIDGFEEQLNNIYTTNR